MKSIKFTGNLIKLVENKLIHKFKATKLQAQPPYYVEMDKAYCKYNINNKNVEVMVQARLYEDVTTISSQDIKLLGQIESELKDSGNEILNE